MDEIYKTVEGFENYEVSNFGFIRSKKSGKFLKGCPDKDGYLRINLYKTKIDRRFVFVHRIVALAFIENPESKPQVDHIDNNEMNNNVVNLRWASHSENNRNTKLQKNNKSGVKGVCWCQKYKKWRAHIHFNGKNITLGNFNTIEEATKSRINAANKIYGEFVNHTEILNP
jgi:hypothetical protein